MKPQFKTGLKIAIAAVIVIALFDILAAHSGVFGSYEEYTQGNFTQGWWNLFYNINVIVLLIIAGCYYFFARKDFSETLGIFLTSYILWFTGLADAFYFFLQGKMISSTLIWLNGHPVIGRISSLIGSADVTRMALIISIILGFVIVYFMNKYLEKQKW